jgi:hypothetical protein
MDAIFDLFGDPVPENFGGRGRPQHIPTRENRNKVMMLLAFGWNDERIARSLSITAPTFRKHYFSERKFRGEQRDRMDAALAMKLWQQVEAGNVAAMREFRSLVERNDLMLYGQPRPAEAKEPRLGKKEAALAAAQRPDTGTALGELMALRQAPDRPN